MAARRPLPPEAELDGFDMTPMIDIVFQLIIFFMLVSDLARARMDDLTLPTARKAQQERSEDPATLVLNVKQDGTIRSSGVDLWTPRMGGNTRVLEDLFERRRNDRRLQEIPGKTDWVKYPVLIRADRSTSFEHVQKLLMIATLHGGVTRVQLGARQETAP